MKIILSTLILLTSLVSFADAEIGKPAPDFAVLGQDGKVHKLADYAGQNVVLEWYNQSCPYVRKHYDSKNMQETQAKVTGDKTFQTSWLTVISSASGKQGFANAKEAQELMKTDGMTINNMLLDSDGKMGKAYGAKTTPHMFIINPKGVVVYAGAIDSIPSGDKKDIAKSTNYVTAAMAELKANKPISTSSTKPYGCGVKY